MMLIEGDVVINVDPTVPDLDVLIVLFGQGAQLTGLRVDDQHRWATVIQEALLTSLMGLAHGARLLFEPVMVAVAALGVNVTPVWVPSRVLLPQQLLVIPLCLSS